MVLLILFYATIFQKGVFNVGTPVLIMGKSGSGKSTSLRNFGENEILLINVKIVLIDG